MVCLWLRDFFRLIVVGLICLHIFRSLGLVFGFWVLGLAVVFSVVTVSLFSGDYCCMIGLILLLCVSFVFVCFMVIGFDVFRLLWVVALVAVFRY